MASAMDVDEEEVELPTSSSSKGEKKRFEVKKVCKHNLTFFKLNDLFNFFLQWNAVALWAWGMYKFTFH